MTYPTTPAIPAPTATGKLRPMAVDDRSVGPRDHHGRRRALLAVAAAGALVAIVTVPAAAQVTTRVRTTAPVAATPALELELLRRQADEARVRLERFLASLAGRPATAAALDSLSDLQRSMRMLHQRAGLLEERARFRALEAQIERDDATPSGWFGVDVQTLGTSTAQSDGRMLVSSDYPRVVAVEPGSPAARAGLMAGDRLIAIRGTDLRGRPLDLRSVLQPGMRVPVRLERDGVRRDVTVAITVRPSTFSPGTRVRVIAVSPDGRGDASDFEVMATSPADAAARADAATRAHATTAATMARVWGAEASAPSPITYLFRGSPSVLAVAGAELMRVTDALRVSLGVNGGVYVISVAPRTPAERAGLKEGDVLVRADGVPMESPVDFFRVLQEQTDGLVKLDIIRARRPLSVDLRW